MTMKHTAGEWIDRGTSCVGTRWQLVASVYPMEDENPEEHAANKRLIAAVPLSDVSSAFAMEQIKSTTALPI